MKISLTRALSRIKTLENEISGDIVNMAYCGIMKNKGSLVMHTNLSEKDFSVKTKANYQALNDKLKFLRDLKSAVAKANSTTEVEIAGKRMTIFDALSMKATMILYEKTLMAMRQSAQTAQTMYIRQEESLTKQADEIFKARLEAKEKTADVANQYETFKTNLINSEGYKIVDPLNLNDEIENLKDFINAFKAEVDFVLSEVNAKTTITVQ